MGQKKAEIGVAFWVKTTSGEEAIVRANPTPRRPVLIVPGIGGSFPQDGELKNWILNRGVEPDTLQPEPVNRIYDDLDAVIERDEPEFLINVPGLPQLFPQPTVLPFQNNLSVVPESGEIWYKEERGLADPQGDGTVPLLSAIGTFEGDTRENIQLEEFLGVQHTQLPFNKRIQQLILRTLGISLNEILISTDLNNGSPLDLVDFGAELVPLFSQITQDPVEGFLIDGSGRRLGYSRATGPVTEIPNSVWFGEEDGIGFFVGPVEGPFQLQLTGLGEEYFVSVSLETEAGPGAIEAGGFLAAGEQLILDIPVNNFPIIDLNGSGEKFDFSTTFEISGVTVAIVDPSLVVADSDSPNLQSATITITNPQDGTLESLSATPAGNIAVAYDAASSTLTLTGSDTLANYQQVLRTVTYTNTAATPNLLDRKITFVVDDGVGFNSLSPVATTTLTFAEVNPGEIIEGTPGRDTLTGTDGNDIITGFQGRDIITTGEGKDRIIYTSVVDAGDIVTDFEVGSDTIVLTDVLNGFDYLGSDPLGDGIVQLSSRGGDTFLQLDPDGFAGEARPRLFALVQGISEVTLNNASNFVF